MTTSATMLDDYAESLALADVKALIHGSRWIVTAHGTAWPLGPSIALYDAFGTRIGYVVSVAPIHAKDRTRPKGLIIRARLLDGRLYRGRQHPTRDFIVLKRETS